MRISKYSKTELSVVVGVRLTTIFTKAKRPKSNSAQWLEMKVRCSIRLKRLNDLGIKELSAW